MKPVDIPARGVNIEASPDSREYPGVTRRYFVIRLAAFGGAIPIVPFANQVQRPRVRRIGLAIGDDPEGGVAAFRETLRELGYVEGQNLVIEARDALRAPPGTNAAADLARMDLELVVVPALPAALAARAANPAMPLVIVTTPGLISNGFAKTIERPGGNATGIDELPPGVTARRLELLKTARRPRSSARGRAGDGRQAQCDGQALSCHLARGTGTCARGDRRGGHEWPSEFPGRIVVR